MKFENYKQDFEREKLVRIASLEEENSSLNSERATHKNSKAEHEKAIKELNERIKVLVSEHEKEMAISSQKQEFISQ